MTDTADSYSNRANAKRGAEKMITAGTAPAIDYGIRPRDDGRFEIAWKTAAKASPTTSEEETEIATACDQAEANWSGAGEAEAASMTESSHVRTPQPRNASTATASTEPPTAASEEEQTAVQAHPGANGGESSESAGARAEHDPELTGFETPRLFQGQDRRVVLWCEASGMVPQIVRIADPV
jgi:hypothetical protein